MIKNNNNNYNDCNKINNYIQESLLTNLNINGKKIITYINNFLIYNTYLKKINKITKNQDYNYHNNNIEIENQLIKNEENKYFDFERDELFIFNCNLTKPINDNKNKDIEKITADLA